MHNNHFINRILYLFNPRFNLPCNHYICGSNLAIFNSFAQIESCLTGITNTCKNVTCQNNCIKNYKNNYPKIY